MTDYRPFGSPLTSAGITSRTTYIDRETDAETSLGSYGVRLYDAELGRFTSVDPLWGLYEGLQPYQYAGNSPVGNLDASGLLVQAVDECAQSAIRTSIEWSCRESVEFDRNGVLNTAKLLEAAEGTDESSNVYRLAMLARSSDVISLEVVASFDAVKRGDEVNVRFADLMKTGVDGKATEVLGLTLFPRSAEEVVANLSPKIIPLSTDNVVRVVLRDDTVKGTRVSAGKVAAHELYLHAFYFQKLKSGEAVIPIHKDGLSDVDRDQVMVESNVDSAGSCVK